MKTVILVFFIFLFSTCGFKNKVNSIVLPDEVNSEEYIDNSLGVIEEDLVRIRKDPSKKSAAIGTMMRGTVFEIKTAKIKKGSIWYYIKSNNVYGWVKATDTAKFQN